MTLSLQRLSSMKWRTLLLTLSLAIVLYTKKNSSEKYPNKEFKSRNLLMDTSENENSDIENSWFKNFFEHNSRATDESNACKVNKSEDALLPPNTFTDDQMKHGAIVLYVIGVLYMFYAIAIVCDNYFVPTLDIVIDKFKIAPDVAGATFMAAGGSAPELFTSVIGVFIVVSDVGIGTIVGSAVFNVLFVIAACAFASKKALSLTAYPLVRDTIFYSIALGILVYFFYDNLIKWWEALVLFLWYILYVTYMKFNTFLENQFYKIFPSLKKEEEGPSIPGGIRGMPHKLLQQMKEQLNTKIDSETGQEMQKIDKRKISKAKGLSGLKRTLSTQEKQKKVGISSDEEDIQNHYIQPVEEEESEEEEYENPVTAGLDGGTFSKILCIISMPIKLPMFITVPDPNNEKMKKFYPLSFIGSLLWIIVFTYIMVWWATVICNFTKISDATMGITFLAAGTSVPDLITSVIVARAGHGDMAVSSSIGSNLFDVTVGLPVPWLLYTLIYNKDMVVNSAGMACNIGMLFLMLILVFISIIAFKWKMTKPMGFIMMFLYAGFLSVALGLSECWFSCDVF